MRALILAGLSLIASPVAAQAVVDQSTAALTLVEPPSGSLPWSDEFTTGLPDPTIWHDCAGPWLDRAEQCTHYQAGSGEQVYWNPRIFGTEAGPATILPLASAGQTIFYATRLAPKEHAAVVAAGAAEKVSATFAGALSAAAWKSVWIESTRQVLPGQTLTVGFAPGYSPSFWGGPWGYDHVRGHPYFEVDLAETTFIDAKTMIVRQNIHAGSASNTAVACGTTMKPGWIYPSVTFSPDGRTVTFAINGKVACTKPLPFPMTGYNVILSQQVGGLAKATDATTQPMKSQYDFVRVTAP